MTATNMQGSGTDATEVATERNAPKRRLKNPLAAWTVVVILVCLLVAIFSGAASEYNIFLGSTVVVIGIGAVGQEWLIGRAGQVSLGGAALTAVGAYTTGLTNSVPVLHVFPIPILLSAVIGAVVGLLIGLPAMRLKGFHLLLSTLALQYIVQFIGSRYEVSHPAGFVISPIMIGSYVLGPRQMFLLLSAILLLVCAFLFNLYRNVPGRIWASLKESELATATMGVSVTRWKLLAFVGSSAITAAAGSMYGYVSGIVSYQTFSLALALNLLVVVYLGGVGSMAGVIVGAALVELLPTGLQHLSGALSGAGPISAWITQQAALLDNAIYGLALLVVLLYAPGGLASLGRRARHLGFRLITRRAAVATNPTSVLGFGRISTPASTATPAGPAAAPAGTGLLQVKDITVQYANGALGLSGVSFDVPAGSIVALVGRNGAGKTSAVRAIAGFGRSEHVKLTGEIEFAGESVRGLTPAAVTRRGIALVPERDKVFPTLTVLEHLRAVGLSRAESAEVIDRLPSLNGKATSHAGLLSGGQRQSLALAMAMARQPRLLVVDEMSLGLSPIAIKGLMADLRAVREQTPDVGILVVDQALDAVGDLADFVYVLENGRIATFGNPELLQREEIRAAIIGS